MWGVPSRRFLRDTASLSRLLPFLQFMQPPHGGFLGGEAADRPAFAVILDGLDPVAAAARNDRIDNHAQHHAQSMPPSHLCSRCEVAIQRRVLKAIRAAPQLRRAADGTFQSR
jgi:hypothetical protein